ncbi:MAG: ROK family protein [Candidatus Peribacteraceae bacterium]|nr:ROK family protein [Candidatus Peribacteraceae bacterium]MDD5742442.1 ROK family protein [Candidatus Peribacteraceae bacterium]
MPSVLGIDLGGTKLAIGRFAQDTWKENQSQTHPTTGKTFSMIVEEMLTIIRSFRKEDTRAIGIGVPGLVGRTGNVLTVPNIPGGDGFPLLDTLQKETGLPVTIENDSSCFALAEAVQGAGRGERVVIGITMGTGVGGGIIIDGKIFRGSHGFAAEFGHMLLKPGQGPERSPGRREESKDESPAAGGAGRGEIEEYLSGTALRRRCPAAKRPEDTLDGPACAHLHATFVREIAWMCVSLTHCLDPGIIVFGGSAGRALEPHLASMKRELKHWMLPKSEPPALAIGTLHHSGSLGAALLTATI